MGRKKSRGKAIAIQNETTHIWNVECTLCKDVLYNVDTITKNSHIPIGYIKAFNYSSTEIGIIPLHYNTLGTLNDTTIEWTCNTCNYISDYPQMV